MEELPPYRLHESLGYQLSLTARSLERRMDENLRTLGLTRITWCVLLAVGNEGLTRPSDIAAFIGIDRTATSRALRLMEAAGMVARACGANDRRTTQVRLTDKGRSLLARATPFAVHNAALLAERLSEEERAQLRRLLRKARADDALPLSKL